MKKKEYKKMMKRVDKHVHKLLEMFGQSGILEGFEDGEEISEFLYALTVVFPGTVYNSLSGRKELNALEFSHLVNTLCFDYMRQGNEKDETMGSVLEGLSNGDDDDVDWDMYDEEIDCCSDDEDFCEESSSEESSSEESSSGGSGGVKGVDIGAAAAAAKTGIPEDSSFYDSFFEELLRATTNIAAKEEKEEASAANGPQREEPYRKEDILAAKEMYGGGSNTKVYGDLTIDMDGVFNDLLSGDLTPLEVDDGLELLEGLFGTSIKKHSEQLLVLNKQIETATEQMEKEGLSKTIISRLLEDARALQRAAEEGLKAKIKEHLQETKEAMLKGGGISPEVSKEALKFTEDILNQLLLKL